MIIGSIVQGFMADKAGKAQARAADQASAVSRQNFLDGLGLVKPQIAAGDRARQAYMFELGLGERPTWGGTDAVPNALGIETVPGQPGTARRHDGTWFDPEGRVRTGPPPGGWGGTPASYRVGDETFGTRGEAQNYLDTLPGTPGTPGSEYGGFKATPGYDWRVSQGAQGVNNSFAARGMTNSGAAMKAMERFRQGLASQEYGTFMNRLAGVSGAGQQAAGNAFAGYQNQGNAQSNIALQKGNALASSHIGVGNAVSSGVNNVLSGIGYGMNKGWF